MSSHISLCFSFFVTCAILMKRRDKCQFLFCHGIEILLENDLKTFALYMPIYIRNTRDVMLNQTLNSYWMQYL